jgi:hypothetical protein
MELHTQTFATLGAAEQQAIREDVEERYISYAFLRQSGTQHGNLKVDLQNDFTTGNNRYQRTANRFFTYLTSTARQLTQSERTHGLLKRVVGGMEIKLVEETEPGRPPMENLLTKNIGRTRNALSATRRGIHHRTARKMTMKMTSLVPAKQKV